jgi:GNAT superfamily N-acetyltransferase
MIGMRAADASIECRVRPARIGEAVALSELCFRSKQVWGYDDDFMAFCREPLRVKSEEIAAGDVWVAAAADQSIAGVVALAPAGEPATLDLDKLFIEPGWIRGGVGRLLLAHAIGEARRRGATRLTILADPNAAAFYEQNGACFIRMASSDAIPGRFVPLYEIVW